MRSSLFSRAIHSTLYRRALWSALLIASIAAALIGSGLAQKLAASISEPEGKALISISKVLASAPTSVSENLFQRVGFGSGQSPPGWRSFPLVRKIETIYLAAEQAKPRQGAYTLALMAQSLAQQYEPVKYDPSLKDYLSLTPPAEKLTFANLISEEKPDPAVQKAILALSRYSEGGPLGGPAGILQYHFNLPPEVAYEILRSSSSSQVALLRGLAQVPVARRQVSLERLVAHADMSFPDTAPRERDLDPYRSPKKQPAALASVIDEHPGRGPDSPFRSGTGGGGGGGGGHPSGNSVPDASDSLRPRPTVQSETTLRPQSESSFRTRPQEVYRTRVSEWYGSSPMLFEAMVAVEGGAGGVVFGNSFHSLINKKLASFEYFALSADGGQLIFHFADGSQGTYGPVKRGDVYAAYNMVYGDGKSMPSFKEGGGLPLLGIEKKVSHYDLVDDEVQKSGIRWSVVAHPALAHVALGRSVLMTDVLPIGSDDGRPNLETLIGQYDAAKIDQIYKAFPTDVADWKVTDAPIALSLNQGQIIVRNALQTLSSDTFLSIREYRGDKKQFDPALTVQFTKFAPLLIAASADYRNLSDFVPVFDLFRWTRSHNVQAPADFISLPEKSTQTIPDWVVLEDESIRLLFNGDSVSPLQSLESKIGHRLGELRSGAPETMRSGLESVEHQWLQNFRILEQIEFEKARFAEEQTAYYRISQNLESATRAMTRTQRSNLDDSREGLEETIELAENADTDKDDKKLRQEYERLDGRIVFVEIGMLPSQKLGILAMHDAETEHIWKLVPLRRLLAAKREAEPKSSVLYDQVIKLLPDDVRHSCEELRAKIGQEVATSATDTDSEVYEAVSKANEQIRKYFAEAPPQLKEKYASSKNKGSTNYEAFLSSQVPALAAARRDALLKLSELQKQKSETRQDANRNIEILQGIIKGVFPEFVTWAHLLTSCATVSI